MLHRKVDDLIDRYDSNNEQQHVDTTTSIQNFPKARNLHNLLRRLGREPVSNVDTLIKNIPNSKYEQVINKSQYQRYFNDDDDDENSYQPFITSSNNSSTKKRKTDLFNFYRLWNPVDTVFVNVLNQIRSKTNTTPHSTNRDQRLQYSWALVAFVVSILVSFVKWFGISHTMGILHRILGVWKSVGHSTTSMRRTRQAIQQKSSINILDRIKEDQKSGHSKLMVHLLCQYYAHIVSVSIYRKDYLINKVNTHQDEVQVVQLQLQIMQLLGIRNIEPIARESIIKKKEIKLNTVDPFLPLFQYVHKNRNHILDAYLTALIRKERFEKLYNEFLAKAKAEDEERQKRLNLTLEQVYSKYLAVSVDTLPEVDQNLSMYLSSQFERLIPHEERKINLRTNQLRVQETVHKPQNIIQQITSILPLASTIESRTDIPLHALSEVYTLLKSDSNNIIQQDALDQLELNILDFVVRGRELSDKMKTLKKHMMIFEASMGIVDIEGPLWSKESARQLLLQSEPEELNDEVTEEAEPIEVYMLKYYYSFH
jgi:hypothetical protein